MPNSKKNMVWWFFNVSFLLALVASRKFDSEMAQHSLITFLALVLPQGLVLSAVSFWAFVKRNRQPESALVILTTAGAVIGAKLLIELIDALLEAFHFNNIESFKFSLSATWPMFWAVGLIIYAFCCATTETHIDAAVSFDRSMKPVAIERSRSSIMVPIIWFWLSLLFCAAPVGMFLSPMISLPWYEIYNISLSDGLLLGIGQYLALRVRRDNPVAASQIAITIGAVILSIFIIESMITLVGGALTGFSVPLILMKYCLAFGWIQPWAIYLVVLGRKIAAEDVTTRMSLHTESSEAS